MQVLWTIASVDQGRILIAPWNGWLGGEPSIFTGCRLSIGNTLERDNASVDESPYLAILGIRDCRTWGAAVSRFLMSCRFGAVGCPNGFPEGELYSCRRRQHQRLAAIEQKAIFSLRFRHSFPPSLSRKKSGLQPFHIRNRFTRCQSKIAWKRKRLPKMQVNGLPRVCQVDPLFPSGLLP